MTSLAPHMEAFLREHMVRHRGNSPHTCDSYAYSFQSLFEFASQKLKVTPSALMLEQLDASLISLFLEYLESTRGNSAETRNIRLAAIRSFFKFLQHREPAAIEQVRRVLAIPFKRTDHRLVPYLAQEEMQALLDAPDPSTRMGVRDRAILHLALCAGLRVSELILLCHKRKMQKNGQQGSCWNRNLASWIRSVAIECGLSRSARMRRAAGPEVGRNFLGA